MPVAATGFISSATNITKINSAVYFLENEAAIAVNRADKVYQPVAKYSKYIFAILVVLTILVVYLYFSALLTSREKDVGVLRTNGYTKWEIAMVFILEALIISVGFIILSIITSAIAIPVIATVFNSKYDFLFTPVTFTIRQVGLIVGFQLLFATVGILLPLLLLLRKKPRQIIDAGK